jgi:hypothetical protein
MPFLIPILKAEIYVFVTKKKSMLLRQHTFFYARSKIVICTRIARLRNPTLTNREKNCRQGRFAAETRQSRGRQRIS